MPDDQNDVTRVDTTGTPASSRTASQGGVSRRMTIAELEAILSHEDEVAIEILPNGEVRATNPKSGDDVGTLKPLTMRENLGGEYAR